MHCPPQSSRKIPSSGLAKARPGQAVLGWPRPEAWPHYFISLSPKFPCLSNEDSNGHLPEWEDKTGFSGEGASLRDWHRCWGVSPPQRWPPPRARMLGVGAAPGPGLTGTFPAPHSRSGEKTCSWGALLLGQGALWL